MKYNFNETKMHLETALASGIDAAYSRDYYLGLMLTGETDAEADAEAAANYLKDRRFKDIKSESRLVFPFLEKDYPHHDKFGFASVSSLFYACRGLKVRDMDAEAAEKALSEYAANGGREKSARDIKKDFSTSAKAAADKPRKLTKAEAAKADAEAAEAAESLNAALMRELFRAESGELSPIDVGINILRLLNRGDVVRMYATKAAADAAKAAAEAEAAEKRAKAAAEAEAEAAEAEAAFKAAVEALDVLAAEAAKAEADAADMEAAEVPFNVYKEFAAEAAQKRAAFEVAKAAAEAAKKRAAEKRDAAKAAA